MTNFPDQLSTESPPWQKYVSQVDLQQQCQRDLLILLPYMHEDYEAFGGVKFNEIERYYVKAIDDGCIELTENLLKFVIYKLAQNEPLGEPIINYLGSSFHYIVTTTNEHKASRGLRLRKTGKGRHKNILERKRWAALAMHIYILFLLDGGDNVTERAANAEENFLNEVCRLQTELGNLKSQTPEQKLQVAELAFLIGNKDLLAMAKKQWNFAKLMWDSINSTESDEQDRPLRSFEIIRRVVTSKMELTPEGVLKSYLRLLVPVGQL